MASLRSVARVMTALFAAAFILNNVQGAQVALAWDPSPDSGVVAYKLYRGLSTNSYDTVITLPSSATNSVITNLTSGTLYYFAVTAVDPAGAESDYSNVISYTASSTGAPVADAKSVSTSEDRAVAVLLSGSDPTNDPLTFQVKTVPTNGTLTGTAPALTYTPKANFYGTDSFTYTVSDGANVSSAAKVTISVAAVNDAPTLNSISSVTVYTNSGPRTVSLSGIGSGATNETQTLTVTATSSNPSLINPSVAYTSPNSTGTLSFTPALNQTGTATITVTVSDGVTSLQRTFLVSVILPPPTVSNGAEIASDARSLKIHWTTDQSATCTLEYGLTTAYGSSSTQTIGTDHTVTITNLQPATVYYLRVRAANSAGSVAVTPIGTAATEAISITAIPAENFVTTGQMSAVNDANSLDGAYIATSRTGQGKGALNLTLPYGLNYAIWARVKTPVAGGSFYLSVDAGAETEIIVAQNGSSNPYRWLLLTNSTGPVVMPLVNGTHQFNVRGGVANTQIDEFIVSNDPTWQPILATTQPTLTLSSPSTTAIDLSWVTKAGNADSVIIEWSQNGTTFTTLTTVPATQTTTRVQNLSATASYYFRIYARDSLDRTANSAVAVRGPML